MKRCYYLFLLDISGVELFVRFVLANYLHVCSLAVGTLPMTNLKNFKFEF